jgi:hypothetical protein
VDGEDVRVLQPGGEPDLALKALGAERAGKIRMQHLERDRAVVPQVVGEEDGGHAAPPELALEGVRRGQRRLQLYPQVRQTVRLVEGERNVAGRRTRSQRDERRPSRA